MPTIPKTQKLEEIRKEALRLSGEKRTADQLMEEITTLLNAQMLKYNWVGSTCWNIRPIHRFWFLDITRER
jgi:hypothetical protein